MSNATKTICNKCMPQSVVIVHAVVELRNKITGLKNANIHDPLCWHSSVYFIVPLGVCLVENRGLFSHLEKSADTELHYAA